MNPPPPSISSGLPRGSGRIVAFTKDWDDVPTCTTHILREMGIAMPVLWVNSIGTRKPDLAHPSHIGRIIKRLARGFRRAEHKENQLRVLSPLLIPKAQSRLAQWLNRKLFAWQAGKELRDMGDGRIEYWCFVPNAVDLVPLFSDESSVFGIRCSVLSHRKRKVAQEGSPSLHPSIPPLLPLLIYYCVDDWTQFHYLDTNWIAQKERELLARADIIFTVSRYLMNALRTRCAAISRELPTSEPRIIYSPHGVEYEKFSAALNMTNVPADISDLQKPIVGFYGNIYPWVDLGLLCALARRRQRWSFVLIGGIFCDTTPLEGFENVHLLGRREHDDLPRYCAGFDVGIIPYDMSNTRMESVSPVKARELLAAGVPVVASDIPELRSSGDGIVIAESLDQWEQAIRAQISREDRADLSARVEADAWPVRVRALRKALAAV